MDYVNLAAAVGQVASAVLTIPAVVIAVFAYKTSKAATATADTVAAIERIRLQVEMRPQFATEVSVRKVTDDESGKETTYVHLMIEFTGPLDLRQLDEVRADICPSRLMGRDSYEQRYQFSHGDDGYSNTGTNVLVGEYAEFVVTPAWEMARLPTLRMDLTCRTAGYEPWIVPLALRPWEHRDEPPKSEQSPAS